MSSTELEASLARQFANRGIAFTVGARGPEIPHVLATYTWSNRWKPSQS